MKFQGTDGQFIHFSDGNRALVLKLVVACLVIAIGLVYENQFSMLIEIWMTKPEYSHGFLIPLISLFLAWQKWNELNSLETRGSWIGTAIIFIGLIALALGEVANYPAVRSYSLLTVLTGLVVTIWDWRGLRLLWVPLTFLIFMIPMPSDLYENLSLELQLLSSQLGVGWIRLMGISVFLQGNVIDLGSYKLQVAEACNGLRYLFPLMSFGFLCGYLFRGTWWMRFLIFFSTIPIAIFLNGFRIGVVGLLVEHQGIDAAEGFLHYFEGWVIFLAALVFLFAQMWLLSKLFRLGPLQDVLIIQFPQAKSALQAKRSVPNLSSPLIMGTTLLLFSVVSAAAFDTSDIKKLLPLEQKPSRLSFSELPLTLGVWQGRRSQIVYSALRELSPTDYIMAEFAREEGEAVNLYMGYWEHVTWDARPHSPKHCIPASGWKIRNLSPVEISDVVLLGKRLTANRVEIERNGLRQLVYYWYQQSGRMIRTELMAKRFLRWDSLVRGRKDGAIVRLITPIGELEDWADGDKRLVSFAKAIHPHIERYIPN